MSKYIEKAKELRAITDVHYNCAQSVLVPFAKEMGMTEEQAYNLGYNFGAGMKRGSVCGAVTAGLMVMGMLGINDTEDLQAYHNAIKGNHDGYLDCRDLLASSAKKGEDKKAHCDGMVYEAVKLVEEFMAKK